MPPSAPRDQCMCALESPEDIWRGFVPNVQSLSLQSCIRGSRKCLRAKRVSITLRVDQVRTFTSWFPRTPPRSAVRLWWPHTCFQGHTVAGRAPACPRFGHRGDREQRAAGQAAQGARLACAAAAEGAPLPAGGRRVRGVTVAGSPVHAHHGEGVLGDIFYFRTARSWEVFGY